MAVLLTAPAAPPYWVSQVAEACLEALERGKFFDMQEAVRRAAREHGLAPDLVAGLIGREWDRWGVVRGDRRALVTGR